MLATDRGSTQQDVNALLARATLYLSGGAMLASLPHSFAYCSRSGSQAWPLSLMTAVLPEVSVTLSTMRLRSGGDVRSRAWAALFLASCVAFTVRANLGDLVDLGGWDRALVAIWPVWSAIGAAGLVEMRRRAPEPTEAPPAASGPAGAPPPPAPPSGAPLPRVEPTPRGEAPPVVEQPPPGEGAGGRAAAKAAQLAILRAEAHLYPERTPEEWAAQLGCSERTYFRRLEDLRDERERQGVSV